MEPYFVYCLNLDSVSNVLERTAPKNHVSNNIKCGYDDINLKTTHVCSRVQKRGFDKSSLHHRGKLLLIIANTYGDS